MKLDIYAPRSNSTLFLGADRQAPPFENLVSNAKETYEEPIPCVRPDRPFRHQPRRYAGFCPA